jgi:CRISPR system Cascade subunit CasC
MKALLELHILQNFAPSNLNRDDTGSPKDAIFGGVRRARISSQSLKRAMRMYVRQEKLLDARHFSERSKRFAEEIGTRLKNDQRSDETIQAVVSLAFGGMGLKVKDDGKTEYLIFLGASELDTIAGIIEKHWDDLAKSLETPAPGDGKKAKDAKRVAKGAVPEEVRKALEHAIRDRGEGGDAVDVALFGRMLADLPEKNQDAACQVAHALSTNKVEREFDFYTAVDDLKPDDNAGADMLGTVEFNSACYYRYACLDLEKLKQNLQGDSELLEQGLRAFLRAAIFAAPSGKQNSFAAHNPPSFMAFTVRQEASPRNLANAFEQPARPKGENTLTMESLEKLAAEWIKLEAAFGQPGKGWFVNITGKSVNGIGEDAGSVDALVSRTLERVKHALGA